jgi:hypothetical protein
MIPRVQEMKNSTGREATQNAYILIAFTGLARTKLHNIGKASRALKGVQQATSANRRREFISKKATVNTENEV